MAETVNPIPTIEGVDDGIRSAIADRDAAFRKLMVKDTQVNRDGYAEACAEVDSLLEMRHGLAHQSR